MRFSALEFCEKKLTRRMVPNQSFNFAQPTFDENPLIGWMVNARAPTCYFSNSIRAQ
jgi:hypothetical protein